MGRVLNKPITVSFSAAAAMGGLIVCLTSSASAQAIIRLQGQSQPPLGFFVSQPTYVGGSALAVPNSPVPSFAWIPAISTQQFIAPFTAADRRIAYPEREPGMFTCTRNGVVSRIGAVGFPQGQAGEFVMYNRYIVPAR